VNFIPTDNRVLELCQKIRDCRDSMNEGIRRCCAAKIPQENFQSQQ
jgi:hypothetical protein